MRLQQLIPKGPLPVFHALSIALLVVFLALPAFAQDIIKESDKADVYRIEVKDGKVLVNGEVVKELADKEAQVFFSRDGENEFVFFSDDGDARFNNFAVRAPRPERVRELYGGVEWLGEGEGEGLRTFNIRRSLEPLQESLTEIREGAMRPYFALFEQNEEIRNLERRSQEIARQIRREEGEDVDGLQKELEDVLGQIFDLKLADQRQRVEKMSAELDDLTGRIQERSSSRAQIIERRLRELKGERDTLDW